MSQTIPHKGKLAKCLIFFQFKISSPNSSKCTIVSCFVKYSLYPLFMAVLHTDTLFFSICVWERRGERQNLTHWYSLAPPMCKACTNAAGGNHCQGGEAETLRGNQVLVHGWLPGFLVTNCRHEWGLGACAEASCGKN